MPTAAHVTALRLGSEVGPQMVPEVGPEVGSEDDMERWAQRQLGTVLEGRYRLEEVLGCGATGAVFRGVHLALGCTVAIKVLHEALRADPRAWARFEREVDGAARLEHPNCVRILDQGRGGDYFVMPFVRGCELASVIEGGMPVAAALELFDQILAGLEHAHARGVIHRDIKPENMLLVDPVNGPVNGPVGGLVGGTGPRLVLLDFGIAKLDGDTDPCGLTLVGEVFGTPQYMSPEQARGEAVTSSTDLYSAGLVLHELLTGQPPFQGTDPFDLLRQHLSEPPPPLPPHLPVALTWLLDGLLAKDPTQRFGSATAARAALRQVVASLRPARPEPEPEPEPVHPVRATVVATHSRPPLGSPRPARRGRSTRRYASRDTQVVSAV